MSPSVHDVASEQGPEQQGFCKAASDSEWYRNLGRRGSCKRLLELLTEDPTLIHGLGYEDMTVLHKGVQHGCVALVRCVLVDMFDDSGHCKCNRHGAGAPALTREQLLRKTCSYGSTAVNMAVVSGSPKMVVFLEWAIQMCRRLGGQSTTGSTLSTAKSSLPITNSRAICSRYMEKRGREEETPMPLKMGGFSGSMVFPSEEIHPKSTGDYPVPDVKDEDLSIVMDERNSEVESKVISIIEGVLADPGDKHREWMDMVKEWVAEDVNFEFVPLAHVFLHFLSIVPDSVFEEPGFDYFQIDVTKRIIEACCDVGIDVTKRIIEACCDVGEDVTKRIIEACCDVGEDGGSEAMLRTLFNILDPRGRPFLHVAYELSTWMHHPFLHIPDLLEVDFSPSIEAMFWNVSDGAGSTIFHLMAIHDYIRDEPFNIEAWSHEGNMNMSHMTWNRPARSPHCKKLDALKNWCFPRMAFPRLTPVELALLLNSRKFLAKVYWDGKRVPIFDIDEMRVVSIGLLQLHAAHGEAANIETLLKDDIKLDYVKDPGLPIQNFDYLPAIHYAAAYGRVEAIQSILKYPVYDPMVQHKIYGSALHVLLDKQDFMEHIEEYHDALLQHVLPNSKGYKRVKDGLYNPHSKQDFTPRMFTSNEISCINLLLQAGIDFWTPHIWTNELPSPGLLANDEARKWWFEKVVSEVVVLKTSVSYAANATSVVAALVATTSFIGPFQPPLGYGDTDGFVRTDRSSLRVYLVCNSLSFYFSIASILMSLLPAIPMPKESLYDELLRGQRCLKGASLMLLISIICILISFSSASMAVVSPDWHERQVVVGCVIFGGAICMAVLVIYIIRLLRMFFHKNYRFRRVFARYMYF